MSCQLKKKQIDTNPLLNIIASGITIIGDGVSAGPFKNKAEMQEKFEELGVNGYDDVGEKPEEKSE